jgi:ribosome-associated protein
LAHHPTSSLQQHFRLQQTKALQHPDPSAFNFLIVDAIQDIKGQDIVTIDLRGLSDATADFLVVCEGNSGIQVASIADNVIKKVGAATGQWPAHVEGTRNAKWVLVDYIDTVLHVFHREAREFYRLEELWSDGIVLKYENA